MKKPNFLTGEEAAKMIKNGSTIATHWHDTGFRIGNHSQSN